MEKENDSSDLEICDTAMEAFKIIIQVAVALLHSVSLRVIRKL